MGIKKAELTLNTGLSTSTSQLEVMNEMCDVTLVTKVKTFIEDGTCDKWPDSFRAQVSAPVDMALG